MPTSSDHPTSDQVVIGKCFPPVMWALAAASAALAAATTACTHTCHKLSIFLVTVASFLRGKQRNGRVAVRACWGGTGGWGLASGRTHGGALRRPVLGEHCVPLGPPPIPF